jgi:thiol-disulfide isomerase/thioredoxin
MKKSTFIMALLCTASALAQNWKSSFEEALLISKEEDKPIVLVFAGSDWCAPCIKFGNPKNSKSIQMNTIFFIKLIFPERRPINLHLM